MYAMKCDRCGSYFDCNQLRLRGGSCSGESFGHISVRGEHNHCCNYDLCDGCVVDFFHWVNDPDRLMGGDTNKKTLRQYRGLKNWREKEHEQNDSGRNS